MNCCHFPYLLVQQSWEPYSLHYPASSRPHVDTEKVQWPHPRSPGNTPLSDLSVKQWRGKIRVISTVIFLNVHHYCRRRCLTCKLQRHWTLQYSSSFKGRDCCRVSFQIHLWRSETHGFGGLIYEVDELLIFRVNVSIGVLQKHN